jgi:hypothetical protein
MMTLRSLLIGVVTPVLFFLLIPNAEAIKVKRIFRGEKQTLAPQETTFDFEIPTAETLQTLRLLNLDGRLGDNNIAVIAILNGYRRAAPDPLNVWSRGFESRLRAGISLRPPAPMSIWWMLWGPRPRSLSICESCR